MLERVYEKAIRDLDQLMQRLIMRPSSLGGAAYCVALCLSVCPSVPLSLPSVTWRHLANYNDTHVLFGTDWRHPYFSARTEGRISYGHLGRTNSCLKYWYQQLIVNCRYQQLFTDMQLVILLIPNDGVTNSNYTSSSDGSEFCQLKGWGNSTAHDGRCQTELSSRALRFTLAQI